MTTDCAVLQGRLTELNIAYGAAVRGGAGEEASALLSAIKQIHNELVAAKCVPGLYEVP